MTNLIAWFKGNAWRVVAVIAFMMVLGSVARSCFSPSPEPSPAAVQQAAQRAAGATIAVAEADAALQTHRNDSLKLFALTTQRRADSAQRAYLIRQLASMRKSIPKESIPGDTLDWRLVAAAATQRAQSLANTLDTAVAVIALDSSAIRGLTQDRDTLRADNSRLASALQATRDTLAPFRKVIIPAQPVSGVTKLLKAFTLHVRPAGFGGYCPLQHTACVGVGLSITLGN